MSKKKRRSHTRGAKLRRTQPQSTRQEIISRLAELPNAPATKDLLHDMFFEFILAEIKDGLPADDRIREIKDIRFEIMEMYTLAQKAKTLVHGQTDKRSSLPDQ